MSDWSELTTTALLGTARRPVPGPLRSPWAAAPAGQPRDPAVRLLDLAARHRALARTQAAVTAPSPSTSAAGPPQQPPVAPDPAVALLGRLLSRPEPTVVGAWCSACVRHGCSAAAVHWTPLARLAARSTLYDRALLGRVLGERGRWFLRQNPDWRRLAAEATADSAASPVAPPPPRPAASRAGPGRVAEQVRRHPELLFDQPDPWPPELVAAALQVVGTVSLGTGTRSYAVGVGLRLPPELYPRIPDAAAYHLMAPEAPPLVRRAVRDAFLALEQAAYTGAEIHHAFTASGGASPPHRVEIPHV